MGGVARRAAIMQNVRGTRSNILPLDAGNMFGARTEEMKSQTVFLCEETQKLGYRVIGTGEWDLNYGLDFLRDMEKEYGLRFTSANIHLPGHDEPLFPPYEIVEVGGLKVGLISVLSPSYRIVTMTAQADDFTLDSPRDALDRYLPELREKSDLVVLLAQMSSSDTRQILLDLGPEAGIDIAIEGHDAKQYRRINKVGETLLLAANNQGKYLGQLDLLVSRSGNIEDSTLTLHALDDKSPELPELAEKVKAFEEENSKRLAKLHSFTHERTLGDAGQRFLGATKCGRCHSEAARVYSQSGHARAWQSLVTKGQSRNPDCVSCHVVGFQWKNGYDQVADPNVPGRESLQNVQCEACHGYGTEHDRAGAWLTQARQSCAGCHDQENSPEFDYESYWARIAH